MEIAKFVKTNEKKEVVSSIVPRKNQINNKANEVNVHLRDKCEQNNLRLIQQHSISPYHHTNAKGLHLNNYGDKNPKTVQTSLKMVNW